LVFFPIQSGPPFWSQNPLGSGLGKFSVFSRFRLSAAASVSASASRPAFGSAFLPRFPSTPPCTHPVPSSPAHDASQGGRAEGTRAFSSGSRQLANPQSHCQMCILHYTYIRGRSETAHRREVLNSAGLLSKRVLGYRPIFISSNILMFLLHLHIDETTSYSR
jgi:hypothetical protein